MPSVPLASPVTLDRSPGLAFLPYVGNENDDNKELPFLEHPVCVMQAHWTETHETPVLMGLPF